MDSHTFREALKMILVAPTLKDAKEIAEMALDLEGAFSQIPFSFWTDKQEHFPFIKEENKNEST